VSQIAFATQGATPNCKFLSAARQNELLISKQQTGRCLVSHAYLRVAKFPNKIRRRKQRRRRKTRHSGEREQSQQQANNALVVGRSLHAEFIIKGKYLSGAHSLARSQQA
jgi:hypothetical protein